LADITRVIKQRIYEGRNMQKRDKLKIVLVKPQGKRKKDEHKKIA
jgi:hypothetical protein